MIKMLLLLTTVGVVVMMMKKKLIKMTLLLELSSLPKWENHPADDDEPA